MPCFHPVPGYVKPGGGWTASPFVGYRDRPMKRPCGNCVGCRLEHSRQWAIRCHHEASLWEDNCFITLTYDNDHLPEDRGLHYRDFQLFMKKLRKRYTGRRIRVAVAGEYGTWCRKCSLHPEQCRCEKTIEGPGRPHFHALLFNHDFEDKKLFKMRNGVPLYVSSALEQLWTVGFSSVGTATFQSAAYVARYITKKINGKMAEQPIEFIHPKTGEVLAVRHYDWADPETGSVHSRAPELFQPSRGGKSASGENLGGIAKQWFVKYKSDVFPEDFVVVNGRKMRPPKFYERQLALDDPETFEEMKRRRQQRALRQQENNTPERLAVRETVQKARLSKLPRKLD